MNNTVKEILELAIEEDEIYTNDLYRYGFDTLAESIAITKSRELLASSSDSLEDSVKVLQLLLKQHEDYIASIYESDGEEGVKEYNELIGEPISITKIKKFLQDDLQ